MEVDSGALAARLTAAAASWQPQASVSSIEPLPGGASSLTYRADLTGVPDELRRVVVKVAPPGLEPVRNRDVLRQARLLKALAVAPEVKVPTVYFEDAGDPPTVPPLFAMSFVAGESPEPILDDDLDGKLPDPAELGARARSAARVLAALHVVRPAEIGLADEPEVSLGEEIDRWTKALTTVPAELQPGSDEVGELLQASVPEAIPSSLIHGDFRLGNALSVGPEVKAIIDWEIWSRSDPRIDLGWFILTGAPDRHPSALRHAPGMPGPDDLRQEYIAYGGPSDEHVEWFIALVLYKLAAVSALIAKNQSKRGDPAGLGERYAKHVPETLRRARAALV